MHIRICRELPMFNLDRLDILSDWNGHPSEKLLPSQFLKSFCGSILSVRYIMSSNRTSVWKVMTIWISWEFLLFNFERLDMWCAWIWPPSEKLWTFEFLKSFRCEISSVSICDTTESDIRVKSYDHWNFSRAFVVQFRASHNIMRPNRTSSEKLWPFELLESFRLSISTVSICDAPQLDIWVKSYDHLNVLRASVD